VSGASSSSSKAEKKEGGGGEDEEVDPETAKLQAALSGAIVKETPNVKWEDVAGLEQAKVRAAGAAERLLERGPSWAALGRLRLGTKNIGAVLRGTRLAL
jgi:vacuolar protein-sorting-associated protein 4